MTNYGWRCAFCKTDFSYSTPVLDHLDSCEDKLIDDWARGGGKLTDVDPETRRRMLALLDATDPGAA